MPSDTKFFLCALKKDDRHLGASIPGKWKPEDTQKDFLIKFAHDIDIEGELEDARRVHSVPSVFARPIQFYQALRDEECPIHGAVRSEWRGLLGILALRDILHVNVSPSLFQVSPPPPVDKNEAVFRQILERQMPKPEGDWKSWSLLKCDDQLLGATSPWTIVYTAAEYDCPEVIPWRRTPEGKKNHVLIDPIDYYDPSRDGKGDTETLFVLRRWVEEVLTLNPWGMAKHLDRQRAAIVDALTQWSNELHCYESGHRSVSGFEDRALVADKPFAHFTDMPHVESIHVDPPGRRDSAFLLAATQPTAAETIVLSRQPEALKGKEKWRVHGHVLLDQVNVRELKGPKGEGPWQLGPTDSRPTYVIAEEYFFPKKLIWFGLSNRAYIAGANKSRDVAVPLTPEFFEYFTLKDLVERKMLAVNVGDKSVEVRLRLPLQGGDNSRLLISKVYDSQKDMVEPPDPVPALGFWPDFYSEDWKANLAICYASELAEAHVQVAPLVSNGKVLDYAGAKKERDLRVWEVDRPVLGFSLRMTDHELAHGVPCGLVLRAEDQPPAASGSGGDWMVGVDFGTSNTNLTVRKGGKKPEMLNLEGRLVLLAPKNLEKLGEGAGLAPRTMPLDLVDSPFPTLLIDSLRTVLSGGGGGSLLGQQQPAFAFEQDLLVKRLLVENVKWNTGQDKGADIPLKSYLRGLAVCIGAEARSEGVGQLNLHWSYPLALPKSALNMMKDFWTTLARKLIGQDVVAVDVMEGVLESEALARHVSDPSVGSGLPTSSDAISIAIDVGGGSTDVAFWTGRRLVDQVSLKLAANDLLAPLARMEDFVKGFCRACRGQETGWSPSERDLQLFELYPAIAFNLELSKAQKGADPKRNAFVDALFGELSPGDHPWVRARTLVCAFFAGLAFYLGLHARKHVSGAALPEVYMYWGGRGSSLLRWIRNDSDGIRDLLIKMFRKGLTRDMPLNGSIGLHMFGPAIQYVPGLNPKQEVAWGLLAGQETLEIPPDALLKTLVGECGYRRPDGTEVSWDETVDEDELYSLLPPKDFPYMAVFLADIEEFLHAYDLDVDLSNTLLRYRAQVQQLIRTAKAEKQTAVQPVFAYELKAVLQTYQSDWIGAGTGTAG